MSNTATSSSSKQSFITSTDDKKQVKYHSDEEVILASARPKKRSGRRVFKETRHPVYRGVRARDNNKWVCEMRVPNTINSMIWLGTYPTPQMDARAHDVASLALRGKSACLNFADSAWRLTLPESTDAVVIRKAAMKAAEMIAAEDEINNQLDQQCVSEDPSNDHNKHMQQEGTVNVEQLVSTSESEEMHHLLLNIANEPLMSPPMSPPHSTRDYESDDLADMDIFDTQVNKTRRGKGHKGTPIIGIKKKIENMYSGLMYKNPSIQSPMGHRFADPASSLLITDLTLMTRKNTRKGQFEATYILQYIPCVIDEILICK